MIRSPAGAAARALAASPAQQFGARQVARAALGPTLPSRPNRVDDADVEVPEVGWMWQAGKPGSSKMPSAATTVANLKQDRIKAKK